MTSSRAHNYSFSLQKYMLLQEQHEELCNYLDQNRPRLSSMGSGSPYSSPATSPTQSSSSLPPKQHPRRSERRHSQAHARYSSWDDVHWGSDRLDTIPDETMYENSAEEQRLFNVNESIKRELTELLNCETVRSNAAFRMWVQARLMETEKELRSGRRRRNSASVD
ncbi:hypothetical protein BGZ61DRAFT_368337 [Ilyonectria robusta]|uniref:uncharacterized protein n=1 Tax=Ilyonectria robusta TaxID=1079257 RepID=UPI001E8CC475|nr:uncharacterized protein BGZ61DRAFT_368337 [Ilyonectria robusta]KAH8662785.1 hypothetical protein BGZ61DRAFT_368337 [Ilyonectria robusta]